MKTTAMIGVPHKLWAELIRVCDCQVLHRHGRRKDGTWGCVVDCPACKVLTEAQAWDGDTWDHGPFGNTKTLDDLKGYLYREIPET